MFGLQDEEEEAEKEVRLEGNAPGSLRAQSNAGMGSCMTHAEPGTDYFKSIRMWREPCLDLSTLGFE